MTVVKSTEKVQTSGPEVKPARIQAEEASWYAFPDKIFSEVVSKDLQFLLKNLTNC